MNQCAPAFTHWETTISQACPICDCCDRFSHSPVWVVTMMIGMADEVD